MNRKTKKFIKVSFTLNVITILIIIILSVFTIKFFAKNTEYKKDIENYKSKNEKLLKKYSKFEAFENIKKQTYQKKFPKLYADFKGKFKKEKSKVVYLTFDDGPSDLTTPKILNVLKKNNVKATFFVLGSEVTKYPEILKREYKEGHTIGMHSYSHDYNKVYKSVTSFLDEMDRTRKIIQKTIKYNPEIIRFPGGSLNYKDASLYSLIGPELLRRGYVYYDWNAFFGDANAGATESSILSSLSVQGTQKKEIVLMHDIKSITANTLGSV